MLLMLMTMMMMVVVVVMMVVGLRFGDTVEPAPCRGVLRMETNSAR